ncbi:MAG: nucleoside 2-deoxyribosyltransferase [Candidatus Liptonbacteria bacterium]|nr:nucleoside 2-deoxyribosyltransferase [Candidatus Liptonbacteria bacterium]
MKIYFVAAIRGGRGDREWYLQIIPLLEQYGEVVTEHIGTNRFTEEGEESPEVSDEEIFERDMRWIKEADVIVAEVTTASLGVGYELHEAENLNKRILCLYREHDDRNLSPMIAGNPNLRVAPYVVIEDVKKIFEEFFSEKPSRPRKAAAKR